MIKMAQLEDIRKRIKPDIVSNVTQEQKYLRYLKQKALQVDIIP